MVAFKKLCALSLAGAALLMTAAARAETSTSGMEVKAPVTNRIGFNRIGYNRIGYNRIAYNRIAYNRIAYNRIAYNRIAVNGSGVGRPSDGAVNDVVAIHLADGHRFTR